MVKAGAVLLSVGVAILSGYYLYLLLLSPMPLLMKLAFGLVLAGFLLLALAVLRDRLRRRRHEDLKEEF